MGHDRTRKDATNAARRLFHGRRIDPMDQKHPAPVAAPLGRGHGPSEAARELFGGLYDDDAEMSVTSLRTLLFPSDSPASSSSRTPDAREARGGD
jgi:hypothetical protein